LETKTAFLHRETPVVDGEEMGSVRKLAMSGIKRFSRHRGKAEIRQNVEA
jgi:hypothetical protein